MELFTLKRQINSKESKTLLSLNTFIHKDNSLFEYHMNHINMAKSYAVLVNRKLGNIIDNRKLEYVALAHDLFKERSLDEKKIFVEWKGHQIPQDTNRYVRLNLDVLAEYGLDDYFNTDIQLHPLAAGIFLYKEFGIRDRDILYPVMFHSCPIMPVYETLTAKQKIMVDVMMMSDKLSSNYLKINMKGIEARVDLDQLVFGSNGREFNYTMGLYVARLIGQGKSEESQSLITTDHYFKRLCIANPFIPEKCGFKDLGGVKIWPKRPSQLWRVQ